MKTKKQNTGMGLSVWIILLFTLLLSNFTEAQERETPGQSRHKIGFISGIGGQQLLDVTYDYQVVFFQFQYYYAIVKRPGWSFELLIQPQYNITQYKHQDYVNREMPGFELGVNVGFLIRKNFMDDAFGFYSFIGTGPHYVSGVPERQANHFIFSDNFFVGMTVRIYDNLHLDLRPGFRHISNAGFQEANGGVNTFVLSAGVLVNL